METLKTGSDGVNVLFLQRALGVTPDGIFGRETKTAVIAFQNAHSLYPDGVVGPLTWAIITSLKIPSPAQSRVLLGDVYDGDIVDDWDRVKASGMQGAWIKVCQGNNRIGGLRYLEHRKAIKRAGMLSGAYLFPMFDQAIKEQAGFFSDLVEQQGGLEETDLMPMLDHEYWPESRSVKKGDGAKALEILRIMEERLKRIPTLYSGYFTYKEIFENEPDLIPHFKRYPFFLAWYAPESKIKTPTPWLSPTFWQFTGAYPVPGVSRTQGGTMDAEWYFGSIEDLDALIASSIIR